MLQCFGKPEPWASSVLVFFAVFINGAAVPQLSDATAHTRHATAPSKRTLCLACPALLVSLEKSVPQTPPPNDCNGSPRVGAGPSSRGTPSSRQGSPAESMLNARTLSTRTNVTQLSYSFLLGTTLWSKPAALTVCTISIFSRISSSIISGIILSRSFSWSLSVG